MKSACAPGAIRSGSRSVSARSSSPARPRGPSSASTSPRAAKPSSSTGSGSTAGSSTRSVCTPPPAARFSAADNRPGGGPDGPVAVIGYGYAERQFGGAAAALGRTLRLDGVTFTIVGVAPREFFGLEVGRTFDVAVPLGAEPLIRGRDSALGSASTNFLSIVARLPPGQSIEAATVDLRRAQAEIRAAAIGDATPEEREVLERHLASPLTLLPASTGFSYLRRGVPASAADHRRRRRPGPPDRLRERRESAPGAGAVAPARAERPGRARRAALAAGAAALRGERVPCPCPAPPWACSSRSSERRFWSASCRRPRPRSSSTCPSTGASSRSRPRSPS